MSDNTRVYSAARGPFKAVLGAASGVQKGAAGASLLEAAAPARRRLADTADLAPNVSLASSYRLIHVYLQCTSGLDKDVEG